MITRMFIVILALIIPNIALAQVQLNFIEKDAVDLPGNDILDLRIQDVNNDNFPDYVYMDQDSIYMVDGITINKIASIAKIPATGTFNIGDINSDNIIDIAFAGYYLDNPDTNFLYIILGPDYSTIYNYKYPLSNGDWSERPSDVFIGHIFGQDLILLGIRRWRSESSPYSYWHLIFGRLYILGLENEQFALLDSTALYGLVERMIHVSEDDIEFIAFTAFGEELFAIPDMGIFEWDNWTDVMLLEDFITYSIWHTTGDSDYYTDLGHVRNLIIRQPEHGDIHVYFLNFTDADPNESVVCIQIPYNSGHNWQIPGNGFNYYGKSIALIDVTEDGQEDVFIFNPVEIRDAYTGDLIGRSSVEGHRGQFITELDQENDGIEEFFFKSSDSLYIFNLQIRTEVFDEVINIPTEISISDNYPNPFNAMTNFKISVEKKVGLKIEIFNILGRKVMPDRKSVINEGIHNIRLECDDLMSGIYFARFSTSDFSTTRKINLIK